MHWIPWSRPKSRRDCARAGAPAWWWPIGSIDGRLLVATQAPLRIHEIGADRTWNLPGLDNESITCLAAP